MSPHTYCILACVAVFGQLDLGTNRKRLEIDLQPLRPCLDDYRFVAARASGDAAETTTSMSFLIAMLTTCWGRICTSGMP